MKQIFYNPDTGYTNFKQLWEQVKEHKLNVSYKQVKEFYDSQIVNQLYKPPQSKKFDTIKAPFNTVGALQMDLMSIQKYFRQNSDYKYIFCVIDIFSRYVWTYPLKNKTLNEIAPHLNNIFTEIKSKYKDNIITLTSDNGSEFKGAVSQFAKDNNIKQYFNNPHSVTAKTHMAIIKRFNRTLWQKIRKYTTSNGTYLFIDKIPNFTKQYNNTIHSTTKMKPVDIYNNIKIPAPDEIQRVTPETIENVENPISDFNIGDIIRIIVKQKAFDKKSFIMKWSENLYTIDNKKGLRYKIKNDENEILKPTYLARELQKVNNAENQTNIKPELQN